VYVVVSASNYSRAGSAESARISGGVFERAALFRDHENLRFSDDDRDRAGAFNPFTATSPVATFSILIDRMALSEKRQRYARQTSETN
jgi:transcriptional regulator of nitric oxide reductase